jgi:hypothetical protein
MGEQKHERAAVDSNGNEIRIIEWHGDRGTAHMHDDTDLKDPQFYSRFTLEDGTTKLQLQQDKRTLIEAGSGRSFTLLARARTI